jgi:hypothetical protein
MEKKKMAKKARARFILLQFRGSRDELVGMGSLSMRPSEEMMNTLPEKSRDAYLERVEVEVELMYSLWVGEVNFSSSMMPDPKSLLWVQGELRMSIE